MNLEVSLGFMLKMMRGPIEQAVHEQLDKVLVSPTPAKPEKAAAKAAPSAKSTTTRKK
jgi:hypothetical protein